MPSDVDCQVLCDTKCGEEFCPRITRIFANKKNLFEKILIRVHSRYSRAESHALLFNVLGIIHDVTVVF